MSDDLRPARDAVGAPDGLPAPRLDAASRRAVRRAADLWRLAVSLAALAVTVLLAAAGDGSARAVRRGLLNTAAALPPDLRDGLAAAPRVAGVLVPAAGLVVWGVRRHVQPVLRVVPAAVLGAFAAWCLTRAARVRGRPGTWPEILAGQDVTVSAGPSAAAGLAACAAAVCTAGPWLRRPWRRTLWSLTAACAVLGVLAAALAPLGAAAAIAVGGAAGSAVLLLAGAPADRPAPQAVADALAACALPLAVLHELPPPWQSPGEGTLYRATTTAGARLTVRVLAPEDRHRDLFHRLARRTLLRHPAGTGASSVLAVAEHALLMLVFAARAGARVDEPVMAYPVAQGGALVATAGQDARPLSALSAQETTDGVLTGVWTAVARLQEHRVGHRALRPEHVLVEPGGEPRLTAFARARLNAPADVLGSDLAELLATTAVRVGPRRATACALAGLGPERLASCLPYLQPIALLGPARSEVARYDRARARAAREGAARRVLRAGGRPSLLRDLGLEVARVTGAPPAAPARLARFTWKSALSLLGAFLVLHLVLPQLADAPATAEALRGANWWWVLAVLPVTFLSQAFSTCLQLGTVPAGLPFGPTYQVQFAGSLLNRITPGNAGGMALNLRYVQKTGVETGAATASVGLQSLAAAASNAVVAAVFFAWAGRGHARPHPDLPVGRYVLWGIALLLAAAGLIVLAPPGRRFLSGTVWPFLRAAGSALAAIASQPARIAAIAAGALGLPLVQIAGLALSLHAFGAALPVSQIGAAYMAARLIAGAAPVPGGLGALEAGLIAGLGALGVAAGTATSAVLVYRLLTYWLNVPVGAVALAVVQRRGYV